MSRPDKRRISSNPRGSPIPDHALAQLSSSGARRRQDATTQHTWADHSGDGDPVLMPDEVLDERYRINRLLGAGGMGTVYAATEIESGRRVAIKTMIPKLAIKEKARMRFRREAQAIMRMDHDNFVKILDYGEMPPHTPYLVMEYLEGGALRDVMESDEPLTTGRALEITKGVLQGLAHAHARGVIHRDIKPENVFMVAPPEGSEAPAWPKILDLGLAKLVTTEDEGQPYKLTMRGAVFGTPAYMAPEQGAGEEVDARADLYSVTVMLYELVTGQRPFLASDAPALLVMHKLRPPPSIESRAPFLAAYPRLQQLIARGLAKKAGDRFASAEAYLEELDHVIEEVAAAPPMRRDPGPGRTLPPEEPTFAEDEDQQATQSMVGSTTRRPSTMLFVLALVVLAIAVALFMVAS